MAAQLGNTTTTETPKGAPEELASSLESLVGVEGQEGEESGADAQDPAESDEVDQDESPSTVDAEAGEGTEGDDPEKAEPGSEADAQQEDPRDAELLRLRSERETLLQALSERREPEPPSAPAGPNQEQVNQLQDAILRLFTAEPGKEVETLRSFSPDVQREAMSKAQNGTKALALLAASEGAFVQKVVLPSFLPAFQALKNEIDNLKRERALEHLAVKHSKLLGDEKVLTEVNSLVRAKGWSHEDAVEHVRMKRELAALTATKQKVASKEQAQRALEASRRVKAAPQPNQKGKLRPQKPKILPGGYPSLLAHHEADQAAKKANAEE